MKRRTKVKAKAKPKIKRGTAKVWKRKAKDDVPMSTPYASRLSRNAKPGDWRHDYFHYCREAGIDPWDDD